MLNSVNKVKDRCLAVLLNPISGKRRARSYFRDIVSPMLEISGLQYELFETTSPTFVSDWMASYKYDDFNYTDIV